MAAGDLARAAAWAAAIALVARHTSGNWQLARTLAWLRNVDHSTDLPAADRQPPDVHVIVPVLREQQHVGAALAWWRQILPAFPRMSLTIVSTAREEHERDLLTIAVCASDRLTAAAFPQLSARELADLNQARLAAGGQLKPETAVRILARTPLTGDVVDRLLADHVTNRIQHLTYPGLGRKAAQINHAARSLPAGGYIAVYDVDSRPEPDLLAGICALLAELPEGLPVLQQHALHTAPHTDGPLIVRALVKGSATLQTLWTLRREIPYARRYQQSADRPGWLARLRAGLSQPVGHGLFLRHDVLAELGGLPENTVLDDVPTGVPLTVRGIPTMSVPKLTAVPSPGSIAEVVAQGRRWFWSYLDYPAVVRGTSRTGAASAPRQTLIPAIAAYRGAAWLAASPLTAATVIAALAPRSGPRLRVTAFAGLLLACAVPTVLVAREHQGGRPVWRIGRDSAELLAAYLLRSVGPWLAVWDATRGRHPASTHVPAPKTHRREGAAK